MRSPRSAFDTLSREGYRPSTMAHSNRPLRLERLCLSAVIAMAIITGGLEIVGHGRLPRATVDGTAIVQGGVDDDVASCAICGLAHQTPSVPVPTIGVGKPSVPTNDSDPHAPEPLSAGTPPDGSPRAPPCLASC
jgi:hypothetical protein